MSANASSFPAATNEKSISGQNLYPVAFCHLVSGGDTRLQKKVNSTAVTKCIKLRLPIVSFLKLNLHVCWTITPFGPIASIASNPNHSGLDASISATTFSVRPFFGAKAGGKWMKQPAYGPAHITPQECAILRQHNPRHPTRKIAVRETLQKSLTAQVTQQNVATVVLLVTLVARSLFCRVSPSGDRAAG